MADSDSDTRDSWQPGSGYDATWGPYYNVFFPPSRVTEWVYWKRTSTGVNVVRRLWDQREQLRAEYEAANGPDPRAWPQQHPGVVLDAVQWIAHAACLRCQWLDRQGTYMREDGWRDEATLRALRHQTAPRARSPAR
ncbi:hypothetical protein [Mycolicibacterium baixiangningiae]|uniref:hypothetical protein n=1 Tax=Mycolicibacterium baixiangningiae TaxID=2761578 RepID=UPI0018D174B6|nr:hypothetical protein [Mycolicibacterium baixiangningiae]